MSERSDTGSERGQFRVKLAKGLGLAAILVLLMMWLAGTFKSKVQPDEPLAPVTVKKVETVKVVRMTIPLLIDQVGTVRSRSEARVSTRIMAQVKEIRVREGENVCGTDSKECAPTVLAVLDDRDIQAKIRQAESQISVLENSVRSAGSKLQAAKAQVSASRADLQKTESDFKRYQDLKKHQAATGQQLEHATAQKDVAQARAAASAQDANAAQTEIARLKAQKEQAEAALSEARVSQSHALIQAPFSGKVLRKMANVGDMASPGQPLFLIEIASQPELHAIVSESLISRLTPGQELTAVIDALGRTFTGKVREIVPSADPSTRTVQVKVSLPPDAALVNGLFGRLRIPGGTYEAIVIPAAAVTETGQLQLVRVVDANGYPHRRFVTLGERRQAMVEVLSGLSEGEEVAVPWTGKETPPTTG